ncbi:MAG: DUF4238 domain-containing protein [Rhodospirillales bacterium]|nr:DUF4238 domain-containing protein [Rhodospirillales bacterium]
MGEPKLHHYVPQFYLRRFTDVSGRLWLWDRERDRIFSASPKKVAAEKHFYHLTELAENGHDPLTMEKQFSHLEGEVARITGQWLDWLRQMEPVEKVKIPKINRKLVSLYIALQFLRTADTREFLTIIAENSEIQKPVSAEESRLLHTDLLWDDKSVRGLADRIQSATWVFGRNATLTPFISSDNPVAFRTGDNAMWLKVGLHSAGTYVVFPLASDIVMYCYPKEPPWEKIAKFDRSLSPVVFSDEMVESENSGQVFMASRFVLSSRNSFDKERAFAKTIGTDLYAR